MWEAAVVTAEWVGLRLALSTRDSELVSVPPGSPPVM